MKNTTRLLLASALVAASAAQAEITALDDTGLSQVSGQSGIVIEAGFGFTNGVDAEAIFANGTVGDFYDVDWSQAGITIDAFKWIVDVEGGWDQATNTGTNTGGSTDLFGGFIAKGIAIAGGVDITIDATADLGNVVANGGAVADSDGGIGITFARSYVDFRVADMGFFMEDDAGFGAQFSSFGGVELLGARFDGLELVVRGNGL
ncbi:DUF6160 family protein [Allohahella sp. A8]|uniref:DUF6160 family protein n=1 Tax=Allohahella sp. A8 TaxID=3141461 RepID=UPI003A805D33